MNLAEVLLGAARATPEAVALRVEDEEVTYGELERRTVRVAASLRADGIEPGDRLALPAPNTTAFVASYLGALRAGAVVVPLNPQAPGAELDREIAVVAPKMTLEEPRAGLAGPGDAVAVECADDDPAVLLFTAGTAGPPRAAVLTHGNLAANIRQVLDHPGLALGPEDRALAVLPFFHVFGLNVVLGLGLAAGASLTLVDDFDAAHAIALVRKHRVTVLAGVPAMYVAFLEVDEQHAPPDSFATVRLAVSGAAELPRGVFDNMHDRFGLTVYEGYGLTEASPIVTTSVITHRRPEPGSIGPALPGVEVRLVDVDGTDVLPGDPGEIRVRGPNVFAGYWRDDGATAQVLVDGWLRTGDIAVQDDAGELSLVDRTKDLVIVSGFNVYPAEVEEVLREHPDVAEVAVVGEPNARTGEAVVAFVVPEHGARPTDAELIAYCARSLARYKCPTRVEVVDALPRSFAGKVLRRELRDRGSSEARAPGPGVARSATRNPA